LDTASEFLSLTSDLRVEKACFFARGNYASLAQMLHVVVLGFQHPRELWLIKLAIV
jgi:hypothetical protein